MERGLEFFKAVTGFLTKDPTSAIWLLHVTVTDLNDALGENEKLSEEMKFYMGRINVLEDFLWERDRNKIITETLAKPEVLPDFLEIISLVAKTYDMVKDNDNVPLQAVSENIEEISERLSGILRVIIDHAEERACKETPS